MEELKGRKEITVQTDEEVTAIEETETSLPIGVTPQMVKKWKKKYGKIKVAELPLDDEGFEVLEVVICKPDRNVRSQFEKLIDKDPLKARLALVTNCVLTHMATVREDDDLLSSASNAVAELITFREARTRDI